MDKKDKRGSQYRITRSFATKDTTKKKLPEQPSEKTEQQDKPVRIRPTFNKAPSSNLSASDPIILRSSPQKTVMKTSSVKEIHSTDNLMDAIQRRDLTSVQIFLKNFENNPNLILGAGKNNPLHQAVLLKYEEIAYALLTCPAVNSLIKNKDGYAAYQLIIDKDVKKYQPLHHELRLRATLDHIIHAMIMTKHHIFIDTCCSDKAIEKKIEKLRARINTDTLPTYATTNFMIQMIRIRLKYDLSRIKLLLDTQLKDPNQQDEWNNTLLHYAAYLHDKNLILQLITNPRINSLIRNSEEILAQQLISAKSPQGPELRLMLFARNSLDSIIKKEAFTFVINNPTIMKLSPDNLLVKVTITNIKNHFQEVENAQKDDRKLPEDSHLPYYANDQFILEMLESRMKNLQLIEDVIIRTKET